MDNKYKVGTLNPDFPILKDSTQLQKISDAISPITRSVLDQNAALLVASKFSSALEYQQRWSAIIEKNVELCTICSKRLYYKKS